MWYWLKAATFVARAIVGDLYQREQAAKMLAWLMGIMSLAPPLAPVLASGFLVFTAGGLTIANSQAGAFYLFPGNLGGTASLLGFFKILAGSLCSIVVGIFYNETLLPTALVIAVAALCAASFYRLRLTASDNC